VTERVIDTNVLVVANGRNTHASDECRMAVIEALERLESSMERPVLDRQGLILQEYRQRCHPSGQPGVGDAFFRRLYENQANPERVRSVSITPTAPGPGDFAEFPDDPELASFDRSDRKFVAAVIAADGLPTVLNATDSDWAQHQQALERHGVRVVQLCVTTGARPRARSQQAEGRDRHPRRRSRSP
jgi:hypothetical protein